MGLQAELDISKKFHAEGIPLLVSSKLLRSRMMGQIDVARMKKNREGEWIIEVGEVKSSETGSQMLLRGQASRIRATVNFISGIFGSSSCLVILKKVETKKVG